MRLEILKFLIVGGLSTLLNYSLFLLLFLMLELNYMTASTIGFFSGVLFGYYLNKRWTFQVEKREESIFFRYLFVYCSSLTIGLSWLYFQVECIGVPPHIAQILMIGLTTCLNFLGVKLWAFKNVYA